MRPGKLLYPSHHFPRAGTAKKIRSIQRLSIPDKMCMSVDKAGKYGPRACIHGLRRRVPIQDILVRSYGHYLTILYSKGLGFGKGTVYGVDDTVVNDKVSGL